jgi:hypothetical protein
MALQHKNFKSAGQKVFQLIKMQHQTTGHLKINRAAKINTLKYIVNLTYVTKQDGQRKRHANFA